MMSSAPLVHALVLNHNGRNWLARCLGSLLATSYPRLHITLIDNGSADDSLAVARSFAPRVEVLPCGSNLGFCAANNLGIARALDQGADYIALLNNDTYFEPEWLDRLVEVGEADPRLGILGPIQLVFDGNEFNSWMTTALPPATLQRLRDGDSPRAIAVEWVEGSALVARSAVFDRIGRLDPLFFIFFEECDFCRRARAAGFEIALVPSSKIHHFRGGFFAQPARTRQRDYLMLRNGLIYSSTDPSRSIAGNLGGLLLNDAVNLKQALIRNGDLALWARANFSVLASLPAIYRKWRADRRLVAGSPASSCSQ